MRKVELIGFLIVLFAIGILLIQCVTGYPTKINISVPVVILSLGFVVFIIGRFMR